MILIGQYDSPFVRRVAVALRLYGIDYEHRPWSAFGDAEKLTAYNPLRRVPTLILDDGEVLIESGAILDHLDERVGPEALIARGGDERRAVLKLCALATGLCDKMVSLVYERILHETASPTWVGRCGTQIGAVLDMLEQDRSGRASTFWFGEHLTHADVAVACAMRFLREAHGDIVDAGRWPRLIEQADRCEALEAFRSVVQPFVPPGR
jgi:glutathione S-transferase